MTEPTTPPAGWYPAPHANGEQRYWDGTQWLEPAAPAAISETATTAPKKRIKWWGWALIGVAAVLVLGGIGGALAGGNKTNTAAPAPSAPAASATAAAPAEPVEATAAAPAPSTPAAPAAPAEPAMTVGQKNAVKKAESYLSFAAFSRQSLIEQLEFEKFPTEDATFAVDHITVDWNEQAAKKAQSYLDMTSFSRDGLIDQLTFEGFTPEQAEYGVTKVGL